MKMGLLVCFVPYSWDYILRISVSHTLTCPRITKDLSKMEILIWYFGVGPETASLTTSGGPDLE